MTDMYEIEYEHEGNTFYTTSTVYEIRGNLARLLEGGVTKFTVTVVKEINND